ncbi:class I SAM-dependent methyltransferase [Ruegeria sp. THAF33]|uniref:class I SAM-dependent methyltransferase n=1 Tax=Ruegeria sp. THAF33 TaxID=2587853 RepID=UPI00126890E5|nr:methyltransferase domain-containing protein [Ruegeria sp. THAF33]QFT73354.1 Demethylmenaquinone methyltransferase [Ruegeria sp. THAF33]
MIDPYADVASLDIALQERVGDILTARGQDPAHKEMRKAFLKDLNLPPHATALELGSGTGHVTLDLIETAGATRAHGIEASPLLVAKATEAFSPNPHLSFEVGDARKTGLESQSYDLILLHSVLCHVHDFQNVVREAHRLLKPGGVLAICDGEFDNMSAPIPDHDLLDQLILRILTSNVTNLWVMRQLPEVLTETGFKLGHQTLHKPVSEHDANFFLTIIEAGADQFVAQGRLLRETAVAIKAEARVRALAHCLFCNISYISQIAYKPRSH